MQQDPLFLFEKSHIRHLRMRVEQEQRDLGGIKV
jgi:hypothetical protein